MAEDLTKIQFTLCNEIKAELKAVKESVTAIPFSDLKQKIVEATNSLEERMCGLEDKYNELKRNYPTQNYSAFQPRPFSFREVESNSYGAEVQPLDQHETSAEQGCSRQHH